MAHRRTIRFIELKIEFHEQNQMPTPKVQTVTTNPMSVEPSPKVKAQAKAKGYPRRPKVLANQNMPGSSPGPVDGEDDIWEWNSDMYASETMKQIPLQQDPDFLAMRDRLMLMENALQRVIQHLDRDATPAPADLASGPEEFP